MDITAMARAIHKRPQCACRLAFGRIPIEKERADSEKYLSAQLKTFGLGPRPGEGLKQRQPRILEF